MRCKPVLFLSLIASFLLLSACSEDFKLTKSIYTDWWPVHAVGSSESDLFSASWNGDLDKHGNIEVTFKNKNNPSVTYTQTISYMALSFSKSREKFCYIDLNDNYASSRYLKFEIKDGMIYMEKLRDDGGKAGEMEDGKPIELKDENILVIGGVTYQKYSYYKDTHPNQFKSSIFQENERIPILSYK